MPKPRFLSQIPYKKHAWVPILPLTSNRFWIQIQFNWKRLSFCYKMETLQSHHAWFSFSVSLGFQNPCWCIWGWTTEWQNLLMTRIRSFKPGGKIFCKGVRLISKGSQTHDSESDRASMVRSWIIGSWLVVIKSWILLARIIEPVQPI